MSEKMKKIESLEDYHDSENPTATEYVYNSQRSIWEARAILEKINNQLKRHEI